MHVIEEEEREGERDALTGDEEDVLSLQRRDR